MVERGPLLWRGNRKSKVKKIANKQIKKKLPWKTEDIANGAVTTPKLANSAVDSEKVLTSR